MSARAHFDTNFVIRQLRRKRRRAVQRRRRQRLMIASAALGFALATAVGVASFSGTNLADAAVARASNLIDLIDQRSPGARTEAQLTKTRHMAIAAPEALAPHVEAPLNLAEVLAPPPAFVPVEVAAVPPSQLMFMPPPPEAIFMTPPGGGGGSPPGGGGGPPGGGGGSPPGSPPLTPLVPGAVPEPGTWLTMLFGFAVMGWTLRQRKSVVATGAVE